MNQTTTRHTPTWLQLLINLGRFQEAGDHCQQALAIKPDYTEARCNLGIALARLGDLPEAIAQYQQALQLDPKNFNAHYNLGNALFEAGQAPAAIEQFQQAIQIEPHNAQAHYNLGNALLQIGQRDAAIEQYRKTVQIKPDYAEAHNNLGSTLLRAGRPQEAIEQYQQATQLMPNHPRAYNNLANAYAQLKRYPEAIAAAQKALELAKSAGQQEFAEQIESGLKNYRVQQANGSGKASPTQSDGVSSLTTADAIWPLMDDRRTTILVAIVLLAGAASVVYCSSLNSPFVFDDSGSVTDNPSIVRLWPLWGDAEHSGPLTPPADLPTSGRPLVNLSLAINYYFGELNPIGYHVFNLIVHVLSALLLMAIVWRTLRLDYFGGRFDRAAGSLALIVALLWTLHPLQTETVVYVTQRTELMVGFFYLATLYASFRYWAAASSAGRKVWLALATTACLAGMACKEVMVTAPVIVLLFERTFITGSFRRAMQKSWPLYVGLFLSWTLLLYLNYNAPRSDTAGFARASHIGLPAYAWWLTQTKVLLLYLKLAIWPWPLSIHYGTPYLQSLGAAWPWVAGVTVLAIATLVLLWRFSAVGFVGGWVLIILSPTLVVPIITEVAAERRMYLPLAAIMTLLVVGGYWLVQRLAPWPGASPGNASRL